MLTLLVAALSTGGFSAASHQSTVPPTPARCMPASDKAASSGRTVPRKLGELPPGQQIKAVWRFDENGCPTPVVVRAPVGTSGR